MQALEGVLRDGRLDSAGGHATIPFKASRLQSDAEQGLAMINEESPHKPGSAFFCRNHRDGVAGQECDDAEHGENSHYDR